jgi:magnesium-transporting ATPase (P-type)
MVLAACHSLIALEEDTGDKGAEGGNASIGGSNLIGDPIEMAALKGVEWSWDGLTSTATPGLWTNIETAIVIAQQKIMELTARLQGQAKDQNGPAQLLSPQQIEMNRNALKGLVAEEAALREKLQLAKQKAARSPYKRVQITQRYHFSSHLQRMSVLCRCERNAAVSGEDGFDWFSLVKGSPEAIQSLLHEGRAPAWYKNTYESLARQGLRVLALAYKKIDTAELARAGATTSSSSGAINVKDVSRSAIESGLTFAGFIAFECKIRSDSRVVMQSLRQSDHQVMMLTGKLLLIFHLNKIKR